MNIVSNLLRGVEAERVRFYESSRTVGGLLEYPKAPDTVNC